MHYFTPDGRRDPRRRRRPCGAAMPAITATASSRRSRSRRPSSTIAPAFQFGHPKAFELASRIAALAPGDLDHVFFCNSGSEAVDTALKIALAYWNVTRPGQRAPASSAASAAITASASAASRSAASSTTASCSAPCWPASTTCRTPTTAPSRPSRKGEPEWGAHLADELERIVALHDASTIAAVIVEPMAGSTGVLPPPKGYLAAPARRSATSTASC